jgi:hypothetical protein
MMNFQALSDLPNHANCHMPAPETLRFALPPPPAFGREAMSRVLMESHLPMNLFPAAGFKNHARTWTAALFDFAPGGRGLPQ